MHVLADQLIARLQDLLQMPGDRLALAVGIRCEIQGFGLAQCARDGIDVPRALLELLVLHRKAMIGIDRAFLRHEVAHVPVGGEHIEVLAQVLLDRPRLRGRLHDDEILAHARRRSRRLNAVRSHWRSIPNPRAAGMPDPGPAD